MTAWLLDTNIPSEMSRIRPEPRVQAWVDGQKRETLFVSAVTVGEIRKGIALLSENQQTRDRPEQIKRILRLEQWFEDELIAWFGERILPLTGSIANRWGTLDARRQLAGTPLNPSDGMIAATALERGLILVTRNARDFAGLGVELINPWESV